MYKEIVINVEMNEVRIAVLEDQQLVEYYIENRSRHHILANVYLGEVKAILPGMQAAFIDIGLDKNAFLHASDMDVPPGNLDDLDLSDPENARNNKDKFETKPIESLLKKGQEVLVQVIKEAINTKGPRVSTSLSFPGRNVVIMPTIDHLGVSKKILDKNERDRLRRIIRDNRRGKTGFIVRTEAEGKDDELIKKDMEYLLSIWDEIKKTLEKSTPPALIYEEQDPVLNFLRDSFGSSVNKLTIDDELYYNKIRSYLLRNTPDSADYIVNYTNDIPIFDAFEIENEIKKAFQRKVWLKSGGYIVIDKVEALTPIIVNQEEVSDRLSICIDVNTGRYTGKVNPEETILKTNLEAAHEIARQLRLRDLGGIIVIDFIDMMNVEGREKVISALKEALKRDRSHTKTFEVSPLGLVEMTRKRVKQDLYSVCYEICPYCEGEGMLLSTQCVSMQILRILSRIGIIGAMKKPLVIEANSKVIEFLKENASEKLDEFQKKDIFNIELKEILTFSQTDFRILLEDKDVTEEFK
ncbi:MAG: Rne/Rng family ribonuclease [Candidatus Coatesbacteria bacterium]|nr:Rne/Rng family ribonuclease [Candidatus Coatesbacteria bacterium]